MQAASMNLLGALFNAGQAPCYMSAEEGSELAAKGMISVDANLVNPIEPNKFLVRITEAGTAALMAPQAQSGFGVPSSVPTVAAKSTFTIDDNIPIPAIVRAGNPGNLKPRTSQYPFELLQVNQSFHVPATAEDKEPHKKMASNVSAANKRSEIEAVPQEMVTTKHKRKVVDAQGKPIKGADGKDTYEHYETTGPKMIATKKFVARQVNATDPKGAGVRVFRTL
jgi:hypothetical protein